MRRTTCLLILVVALIVIAAGRGGGSHHQHNEFVKQANTICADYVNRTAALGYASTRAAAVSVDF